MQFIQGNNRNQTYFATLEDQVSPDNAVRLIDAFIDKLELQKLGFTNTVHKSEGRPPYAPAVLLKLYLYGYLNRIRSSRKLEKECSRNRELEWLLQGLQPNYHTIADFRKLHAKPLQSMFKLYVQFLGDAGLLGKTTIGIDGSKFKAVNSKKNNFNDPNWGIVRIEMNGLPQGARVYQDMHSASGVLVDRIDRIPGSLISEVHQSA